MHTNNDTTGYDQVVRVYWSRSFFAPYDTRTFVGIGVGLWLSLLSVMLFPQNNILGPVLAFGWSMVLVWELGAYIKFIEQKRNKTVDTP